MDSTLERTVACVKDGTCKCGLIFVQKQDSLSRTTRRISGSDYTSGGFYCYSSIPPRDMIILIDPLGNIQTLDDLNHVTEDPDVVKVSIRKLRDSEMKGIFHKAISDTIYKRDPKDILGQMFDKGIASDIIDSTVKRMDNLVPNRNLDPSTLRSNELTGLRSKFFSPTAIVYQQEKPLVDPTDNDLAILMLNELSSNPAFRQTIAAKFDQFK